MSALGRIREVIGASWPFRPRPEQNAAEALLRAVIAASRAPSLYGPGRLSDDMDMRFEAAVLYANLALIRLKGESEAKVLAQEFTDSVFRWFDSGLYEAGVGYQKVPKEMRALAARFYGRLEVYGAAIEAHDRPALADALARNVGGVELSRWPFAQNCADHVLGIAQLQRDAPWRDLASSALWPPIP